MDRRVIYVEVTDQYRDLRSRAKTDVVSYFNALMEAMSPEDRTMVAAALRRLDEVLSQQTEREEEPSSK